MSQAPQGAPAGLRDFRRRGGATRASLTITLACLVVVCCALPQVSAGQGRGLHHRTEESVCCGGTLLNSLENSPSPSKQLQQHAGLCCGKGWGVHCCFGDFCCLDEAVVDVRKGVPSGVPPQAVPTTGELPPKPSLQGSEPIRWKHWAQWLNLAVVITVVALVCAVLTCCWRRDRRDKALHQQRLLRLIDTDVYSYGTAGTMGARGHHAAATGWHAPTGSQWVDFSYRPSIGSPLKPNIYNPGPQPRTVPPYYSHHPTV